ncbi:MAG: alanine racemase, partial [Acidobacteriota bacterium]|nr:alanine racemase [Acidobacteriota bacterium]
HYVLEPRPPLSGVNQPERLACVEVDLDALRRNFARLRSTIGDAAILAVVKAEAYGHGAVPVARCLEQEGADWLGVALAEEGAQLREAGLKSPILVLGQIHAAQIPYMVAGDLVPTLSSLEQLEMWSDSGEPIEVHLKLDTGMHRLGIAPADWQRAADLLARSPRMVLTGLMSHLAETISPDSARNPRQQALFAEGLELFSPRVAAGRPPLVHLCSSAGALHLADYRHGLVRVGLALYGIDPAQRRDDLEGVMQVSGPIVHIVEVADGEAVGYGSSWVATRPSRIGIVAVGYGDGYPYRASSASRARVGSADVPLVGQVNMDMVQIDLTDSPAVLGDRVILLARSDTEGVTAAQLAKISQTSVYETLCRFAVRLPRRYVAR